MKLGLFSLMTLRGSSDGRQLIDETLEMVKLAEAIGFDTAWMAEHHFSNYSMCVSPLVMAAYCAGVTRTIRLGTAVLVLPLYHPVRMVEEMGLVDQISNGRLVVGIGTGYQGYEFDHFGINLEERVERSLEMADIIERFIASETFSHSGKHYMLKEMPICTRMLNGRRPDIYVAGAQPELVERAARDGWIPFITVGAQGTDVLARQRQYYEGIFAKAGKDPRSMPFAVQRYIYVTDSRADARDAAERILYVNRLAFSMRFNYQELDGAQLKPIPYKDEPTPEQIIDNVIIGSPEHCAARIVAEAQTVRMSDLSCFMQFGGMEGRRALRSLERFGAEVVPLLERELGPVVTGSARSAVQKAASG
jgi:alkanesulfonate monooxygenase SsuD/methylene tetrahydromethanopterin reductase-like flavin-dependent oxidoreductase (luciferase family)